MSQEPEKNDAVSPRPRPFWKSILFTILIVTLFFGTLELTLALTGVRPVLVTEDPFVGFAQNIPLFIEAGQPDGSILLQTAPSKIAFFNYQAFPKVKGEKSYRIFCMGESTTVGHPYYDPVSFCGWLRAFLKAADPSRNWEVINAGGVSYASYRIANLMEELSRYQPDLFIVYCGQNEFLERRSYGRLMALPDWALRGSALLSRTRTWAAMKEAIGVVRPDPLKNAKERYQLSGEVDEILTHTVGPTSYHRDDPLKRQVLKHYRYGMERMAQIARGAGAQIVFVQPAVNLKDMSPFKSEHKAGLGDDALHMWEDLYRRASELQGQGHVSDALPLYRQALAIDDRYAELHYRIGQVLYETGQYDEAEKVFWRAVDEDIAPLRILSPMQRIVEEVASDAGAPLVDFPRLLKEAYVREQKNLPPILGKEYFVDHVHTNIKGYRMLGLALFDALVREKVVKPDAAWNSEKVEQVTRQVLAGFSVNDAAEALRILGRTLNWAGKLEEAQNALRQALELQGPHPDTYYFLVTVLSRQGKYDDAINALRQMISHYPQKSGPRLKLAELLVQQGKPDEAILQLQEELQLNPNAPNAPNANLAHTELAALLVKKGEVAAAIRHFDAALRLNPNDEYAHLFLARLFTQQRRDDEALPHLREVIRINPGQHLAHYGLGAILRKRGEFDEAVKHLSEAIRLNSNDASYRNELQAARDRANK